LGGGKDRSKAAPPGQKKKPEHRGVDRLSNLARTEKSSAGGKGFGERETAPRQKSCENNLDVDKKKRTSNGGKKTHRGKGEGDSTRSRCKNGGFSQRGLGSMVQKKGKS